jgi:hypothetical protein
MALLYPTTHTVPQLLSTNLSDYEREELIAPEPLTEAELRRESELQVILSSPQFPFFSPWCSTLCAPKPEPASLQPCPTTFFANICPPSLPFALVHIHIHIHIHIHMHRRS